MKIAIVYHSVSGNTKKVAEIIAEGARAVEHVEVRCMPIEHIDYNYLDEAAAVIFGSPTYYASFSWQIKQWFDTSWDCKLGGKLGAVFVTANHIGGGAESAQLTLIGHLLVKGMLVYSAGSAEGNPYTHYGSVCIKDCDEIQRERARIFGHRVAKKTVAIFGQTNSVNQ